MIERKWWISVILGKSAGKYAGDAADLPWQGCAADGMMFEASEDKQAAARTAFQNASGFRPFESPVFSPICDVSFPLPETVVC
nr:hypothetical protein [Novosphingobium panipatense]